MWSTTIPTLFDIAAVVLSVVKHVLARVQVLVVVQDAVIIGCSAGPDGS